MFVTGIWKMSFFKTSPELLKISESLILKKNSLGQIRITRHPIILLEYEGKKIPKSINPRIRFHQLNLRANHQKNPNNLRHFFWGIPFPYQKTPPDRKYATPSNFGERSLSPKNQSWKFIWDPWIVLFGPFSMLELRDSSVVATSSLKKRAWTTIKKVDKTSEQCIFWTQK